MAAQRETTTKRKLSGRLIVLVIVVMGAGLGLAGLLLRERRGLSLPLQPGAIVVVTCESSAHDAGSTKSDAVDPKDADPRVTRFRAAVEPSSELEANLGSLCTGKMPRESGLVRAGDALRAELPTLAEIVAAQGFATAAFAALDADALKRSGLARGFERVVAKRDAGDGDLAKQAADWLVARATEPSFAWLHLKSEAAEAGFLARLHELRVDEHAAVFVVGSLVWAPLPEDASILRRCGRILMSLQLPVPLLPLRVDPQPVSLVDVFASSIEVFGVPAPDGIGTPYLLHPDVRGPRLVLSTRPLTGAFADADEVWLLTTKVEYENAPVSGSLGEDTPLASEFRDLVEKQFGYRFDEVDRDELLKSEAARTPPALPVHEAHSLPSRVPIARSTIRRAAK